MNNNKTVLSIILVSTLGLLALFIVSLILFFVNNEDENEGSKLPIVTISTEIADVEISVEIADSFTELQNGLMYRPELDEDSGMLFIFDEVTSGSFWMKNTLIPLDMIFIDQKEVIVDIQENAQPCTSDPCPGYPSKYPYKYVIEANGGWADDNNVQVGDKVELSEALVRE